jgi:hypothetical protein
MTRSVKVKKWENWTTPNIKGRVEMPCLYYIVSMRDYCLEGSKIKAQNLRDLVSKSILIELD